MLEQLLEICVTRQIFRLLTSNSIRNNVSDRLALPCLSSRHFEQIRNENKKGRDEGVINRSHTGDDAQRSHHAQSWSRLVILVQSVLLLFAHVGEEWRIIARGEQSTRDHRRNKSKRIKWPNAARLANDRAPLCLPCAIKLEEQPFLTISRSPHREKGNGILDSRS